MICTKCHLDGKWSVSLRSNVDLIPHWEWMWCHSASFNACQYFEGVLSIFPRRLETTCFNSAEQNYAVEVMSILKVGWNLDTITPNWLRTDLCFIILHSWPALISSFSSWRMGLHPVCYSPPSYASSFSPCYKRKDWMYKVIINCAIQGSYNGEVVLNAILLSCMEGLIVPPDVLISELCKQFFFILTLLNPISCTHQCYHAVLLPKHYKDTISQ